MEYAVLARPQWRSPLQGEAPPIADSRIIVAPLQELMLLEADPHLLRDHLRFANPWIVFTSPASVLAFRAYLSHCGMEFSTARVHWAAVGNGTRDQALRMFESLRSDEVIVSEDPHKADASSTLQALDYAAQKLGFDWPSQQFLVIEGKDNRPTLREGLVARGARAQSLALYMRVDVDWPHELWGRLALATRQQAGLVITSTTVVDRLFKAMKQHRIDPHQFRWCTQHAAIAAKLVHWGLGPIGCVRLDPQHLSNDLFSNGHNW
jgi:uroporphyrinogen-III synthase